MTKSESKTSKATYFAYGTLLDISGTRGICPTAEPVGVMRLLDYRLGFAACGRDPSRGGCTLEEVPGNTMYGLLYALPAKELADLDRAAGLEEGLWARLNITLIDSETKNVIAMPAFAVQESGRNAQSHSSTINVYDSKGNINSVTVQFENISSTGELDLWRWEASVNDGRIIPTAGHQGFVKFNPDGSLASFETSDDASLTFEPGGGAETIDINLNMGAIGDFGGITQFSNATTLTANNQDGYGMGDMYDMSFDDTGKVIGHYTNGTISNIAQIAVATFQNPHGLEPDGDNVFNHGANTGAVTRGWARETIQVEITPSHLEMSNVDLTKEFTGMIVAQRGFQANAKVINTSDTLLEEIVRLKR